MRSGIYLFFAVIFSLLTGFYIAYISGFVFGKNKSECPACPVLSVDNSGTKKLDLIDYDLLLVTDSNPKRLLHINHIEFYSENSFYAQATYNFDNSGWTTQKISTGSLKVQEVTYNDSTRELSISGKMILGKNNVDISVESLDLDMVVRAQKTGSKFAGATPGAEAKLYINGISYDAHVAMTAGYFNKYSAVDTQALKVKTHWLMYFDKNWNFYHLDNSSVQFPTPEYYSHSFLGKIDGLNGSVSYYDSLIVTNPSEDILRFSARETFGGSRSDYQLNVDNSLNLYRNADISLVSDTEGAIGVFVMLDDTK